MANHFKLQRYVQRYDSSGSRWGPHDSYTISRTRLLLVPPGCDMDYCSEEKWGWGPFRKHGSDDVLWSPTLSWLKEHGLYRTPFATKRAATVVMNALWTFDPPPRERPDDDRDGLQLRRVAKGRHVSEDGRWAAIRQSAGDWILYYSLSGDLAEPMTLSGDRDLWRVIGYNKYLQVAQDQINRMQTYGKVLCRRDLPWGVDNRVFPLDRD